MDPRGTVLIAAYGAALHGGDGISRGWKALVRQLCDADLPVGRLPADEAVAPLPSSAANTPESAAQSRAMVEQSKSRDGGRPESYDKPHPSDPLWIIVRGTALGDDRIHAFHGYAELLQTLSGDAPLPPRGDRTPAGMAARCAALSRASESLVGDADRATVARGGQLGWGNG
ncbi:hypothetical protein FB472_2263 [Rhodoglobus vestalii]|uniref:Uncharacterized protein n=2 Tax=Rhodoglobus vestalii TaxID=193384 RepID=A0A8H2K827_9MICO|nr:hypothetical protein FB472_2263 [Rhodoglobus vestalii]